MRVRGQRRCTACGHRWSYFETGSAACPDCGSIRSVSTENERTLHTDSPTEFDLTVARSMLDDRPLGEVAEAAQSAARAYLRSRGFVDGGELLDLDGTVLAAAELRYASDSLRRTLAVDDPAEAYFLDLLAGAESGNRPDSVPTALRDARGLAAVDVVKAYRRDLAGWLDEHPHPEVRRAVELLRSHERRIAALEGDVPIAEADALVTAAREIGCYLREADEDLEDDCESTLARAEERLNRMGRR